MTQTMQIKPGPPSRLEPGPARRGWPAVGLVTLGLGAAVVAVLGPLVMDVIRYHASASAVDQIRGGDVAALFLVAPVSLIAALLVWRRHRAGPVLALGPAVYALYTYTQLVLGGDVGRYPGNSELFFPLFVGLFIVAGTVAISAWGVIGAERLPAPSRRVDRLLGGLFLVVAVFLLFGLHLPGLVDAWSPQPTAAVYLSDPAVFWLVKFMDLGIVVPALVTAGIGILRARPWAARIRYPAVAWAALMGSSVAGMAIVMQVRGDPDGTLVNTVAFSGFAIVALAIAWIIHRPLFGTARPDDVDEVSGGDTGRRRGLDRGRSVLR